jgi:hypothetical protein
MMNLNKMEGRCRCIFWGVTPACAWKDWVMSCVTLLGPPLLSQNSRFLLRSRVKRKPFPSVEWQYTVVWPMLFRRMQFRFHY